MSLIPSFTQHVALPLADQYLNYPRQMRTVEVVTYREAVSILSLVTHPKQTRKQKITKNVLNLENWDKLNFFLV